MKVVCRAVFLLLFGLSLAWFVPGTVVACSPPFEKPTIRALGPAQVVVVGTIGQRVQSGRLFHVERWFNGGPPVTPIVIAFKEGEPIGDCSYPVRTGASLIIAPYREPNGRLTADLGTLQADPMTGTGREYLAEAVALFGPGAVALAPPETPALPGPPASEVTRPSIGVSLIAAAGAVILLLAGVTLLGLKRRRRR